MEFDNNVGITPAEMLCKISERYDQYYIQSRGFEFWR